MRENVVNYLLKIFRKYGKLSAYEYAFPEKRGLQPRRIGAGVHHSGFTALSRPARRNARFPRRGRRYGKRPLYLFIFFFLPAFLSCGALVPRKTKRGDKALLRGEVFPGLSPRRAYAQLRDALRAGVSERTLYRTARGRGAFV